MKMKTGKKFGIMIGMALMALVVSSCGTLHRHPRHRHHHPHHHKVVIIAGQVSNPEQSKDCINVEECLAMTEPYSYGNAE